MTARRGLFVRNIGTASTTPVEARLAMAGLLAQTSPGVPRNGLLQQSDKNVVKGNPSTSPPSYDVSAVQPVINRAINDGVYVFALTGTTNAPTTVAPVSGSRIDLIWVKQNDAEKGDADNMAVVGVTQGTAAATPTRPTASVPDGALIIASAVVTAGATATNGAGWTITQEWQHTWARQAPARIAEFTAGPLNVAANTLYGPGTLTLDTSDNSQNADFAAPDIADCILLKEDGLYRIQVYMVSSDTAIKPGWISLRNKAETTVYTEHTIANPGTGGGTDIFLEKWFPAGTIFRPRIYLTQAWPNVSTRIRVVKDK